MLYNEIPTTFPWYEKLEQQNRYRENADVSCDYKLISPNDALLPFQLTRPPGGAMPTSWRIREVNSQTTAAVLDAQINLIHVRLIQGKEYFYYDGQNLSMFLTPGFYESILTWADGVQRFSENFHVPIDKNFAVAADNSTSFLKFEFWNDADISPFFYGDKTGGRPYFRNVLYLDSFITASEPEVVEDGEKDGYDEAVVTFQKVVINYRISALLPDYLKKAVVLMQIHDHAILTTERGRRSGEIKKMKVDSSQEDNGAFSNVDIIFSETLLMKTGCGHNMLSDCGPGVPVLNTITTAGSNLVLSGTAPAGTTVNFYLLPLAGSVPSVTVGGSYSAAAFLVGVTLPAAAFTGGLYVVATAKKFGCDFGFSNIVARP